MSDLTTLSNTKAWLGLTDKPITGITKANPAVVACAKHNIPTGRQIVISSVVGMTQVNGGTFVATSLGQDSFSIGVDSTLYTAYVSGGFVGVDDGILSRLISAVSAWVQNECGRALVQASFTEEYRGRGGRRLLLRQYPVTAVSSLLVDGVAIPLASTVTGSGYRFDELGIKLNEYEFYRGSVIQVSYTGGLVAGDPDLDLAEQATIQLVSLKYKERDRIGQVSKSLAGETVTFDRRKIPADVDDMLDNLRRRIPV